MAWLEFYFRAAAYNLIPSGVLIGAVLLLRAWGQGRFLSYRLVYLLWVIVALRLVIPGPISVQWRIPWLDSVQEKAHSYMRKNSFLSRFDEPAPLFSTSKNDSHLVLKNEALWFWGILFWIVGFLVLAAGTIHSMFLFQRRLKNGKRITDPQIVHILESCEEYLGLGRCVQILESEWVPAPVISGVLRPQLLLPPGFTDKISKEELRCVIMHELGHLQRADVFSYWLLAIVRTIYWFNPLVWGAFFLARNDREMACDEFVLKHLRQGERETYGEALLNTLTFVSAIPTPMSVLGMTGQKKQMERRIHMITNYNETKQSKAGWVAVAVVFLLALAMDGRANPFAEPGLVASYSFENTVSDSGSVHNDGKIKGEVEFAPGVSGSAIRIEGNGSVVVPDNPSLNLKKFTISAWVYPGEKSGYGRILEKGASISYWMYLMQGKVVAGFFSEDFLEVKSSQELSANAWNHVCMTFDGHELKLFVNGVPQGSLKTERVPDSVSQPLVIGAKYGGIPQDYLVGMLDEIKIYDHALSDDDIKILYTSRR